MTTPTLHPRQQQRLIQIGKQLQLQETLMHNHPLTQATFTIAQTMLHYFELQTRWSLAGPLARFLIAMQTIMRGSQIGESQTAFIDPMLAKCQEAMAGLMAMTLPPKSISQADFLLTTTQMITTATVFIATQLLGNCKPLFPKKDPGGAKKGGLLLQELGLLFLLGSHAFESLFQLVAESLELDERNQKRVMHVGLFWILIVLLVITEENSEFLDGIARFMKTTLDSLDALLQKAQGIIDEEQWMLASSHLQLLRRTLDSGESEALPQVIESGLEAFGLSLSELKKDLQTMTGFCHQLYMSFNNIFYKTDQTMTTMNQAA